MQMWIPFKHVAHNCAYNLKAQGSLYAFLFLFFSVGFLPILLLVSTCFLSSNMKEEKKLDPPPSLSLSLSPSCLPVLSYRER